MARRLEKEEKSATYWVLPDYRS